MVRNIRAFFPFFFFLNHFLTSLLWRWRHSGAQNITQLPWSQDEDTAPCPALTTVFLSDPREASDGLILFLATQPGLLQHLGGLKR